MSILIIIGIYVSNSKLELRESYFCCKRVREERRFEEAETFKDKCLLNNALTHFYTNANVNLSFFSTLN